MTGRRRPGDPARGAARVEKSATKFLPLPVPLIAAAGPALAHHPLGGAPMTGVADGSLSGLGHPLFGLDHLFFVLAMGLAARLAGRPQLLPLAYLAAMLAGCAALAAGADLPLRAPMIALSLFAVGALLARGRPGSPAGLALLFAGFGLFHGAALGAEIASPQEAASGAILAGYLIGLGAVQYAAALLAGGIGIAVAGASGAAAPALRMAGAAVAGIGVFLFLEAARAPVLAPMAG